MGLIWIFSTLSRLLSKISSKKDFTFELKKPTWKELVTVGKYHIQKLFVDDILFGPTYYKFKSEPHNSIFENDYFGDFIYPCFDGILMQKWNSTTYKELPDFTLVYFDGQTGQITEIEKIKSFSWIAHQPNENEVRIKWFNGTEGGEVIVDKYKLKTSQLKFGS